MKTTVMILRMAFIVSIFSYCRLQIISYFKKKIARAIHHSAP